MTAPTSVRTPVAGPGRTGRRSLGVAIVRHRDLLAGVTAAAAFIVAFRTFVLDPIRGAFTGRFEDFEAYWAASTSMAAGGSPYSSFDPGTITMSGFNYPPFAAVVARPLSLLDHHAASIVFLWIGLACLLAGAVIAARTLLPATWPAAQIGVVAVLLYPPATYNLLHGQANPVIFLLLALATRSWVRGEQTRCGAILGLAAAIKLAPVLLIVLLVRRRWWRGAAAFVGTGAATTAVGVLVIGPDAAWSWFSTVLPKLQRDNGWLYNQTWDAAVSRLADHSVLVWQPSSTAVHASALALALATVAVAAWIVRPGERSPEERGVEFGAAVAAMLLAGSIAWYAHDVHLLIALFALVGFAARRSALQARPALVGLAAAVLILFVAMPQIISAASMDDILSRSGGGLSWWLYIQMWSLPVAATAGILCASVAVARPTTRRGAPLAR